jgi:hypothetical protein
MYGYGTVQEIGVPEPFGLAVLGLGGLYLLTGRRRPGRPLRR